VHTYRIIKIKGSLHHTIAKLEHYFTIAFRGVFQSIYQNLVETTFDTLQNYNQGMLSGSAQKMSRERLR
jgi:hypothetical protein